MSWISELSFSFHCSETSIDFQCNSKSDIIELTWNNNELVLKIFNSNNRVNYSNGRLYDFNNLSVKKGKEATEEIRSLINRIINNIKEDINETHITYEIPLSIIEDFLIDMNEFRFNPKKYIDFGIEELKLELNKEFLQDKPGFNSERKLKIYIKNKNGTCFNLIYWINSNKKEILWSSDCNNFVYSDKNKFSSEFRPINRYSVELKRFIETTF
jgi:hypothetical protein